MPDNRCLVHITKLAEFSAFLEGRGWTIEEPKGDFVVLRARHPKVKAPVVYHKRMRTDHLTCMSGLPATLASQFIAQQRKARRATREAVNV